MHDVWPDGMAELAPPTVLVTQCEQFGWFPSEAFALGRRQTLGFANIVVDAQSGTRIRVETSSAGSANQRCRIRTVTDSLSAGEWNRVAAMNHRIDVHVRPKPSGAAAPR